MDAQGSEGAVDRTESRDQRSCGAQEEVAQKRRWCARTNEMRPMVDATYTPPGQAGSSHGVKRLVRLPAAATVPVRRS